MPDITEVDGDAKPKLPARETFSREYVSELREENKVYRIRATEAEGKVDAAEKAATKAKAEAEAEYTGKIKDVQTASEQRIIRAELKALAVKEGMIDLDDLKLIDLAGITLGEDGEVKGAEDVLKKYKEGKPHKFGQVSTSNTEKKPKRDDVPKSAKDMTDEEYQAERRKLLKR